ncbi:EamA/RhaT family transporter [Archaeoglobales archaeon]|nr:MAG: EamA/RhaT family transporter [Archaeoglobales archaeon]
MQNKLFKWIVLALTILFWGLAFTAIKYSVIYLNPIELAAMRFVVADIFFALNILLSSLKINKKDLPLLFVLGLFGVTIYHVCLNTGEIYISSGVASLIISTAPIFVLLFSWMFLNETITKGKVLGILIAFLGVAMLSEPKTGNIVGILLVFVSAIAAAVYTVLGKKLMDKYDSVTLTNYAMVLGSTPLFFVIDFTAFTALVLNLNLMLAVFFLGLFSTYLGYQGWYYFLEMEEASKASVFLLTIPFVSLIAGAILLNEAITLNTVIGGLAVVLGIVLTLKG